MIPNQKLPNDKLESYRSAFEKHLILLSKVFGELEPDLERDRSGDYKDTSIQDQWCGAMWAFDCYIKDRNIEEDNRYKL